MMRSASSACSTNWLRFPQAGTEPGPKEESSSLAATVKEPKKGRKPQLDQAGLLRGTFAVDVLACVRCGDGCRALW